MKNENLIIKDHEFNHIIHTHPKSKLEINFEIKNIDIGYNINNKIIENLTFNVEKEDFLSIIGPNGSGKSTLIKSLCRIITPFKGTIKYNGKLVSKQNKISLILEITSLIFKKNFFSILLFFKKITNKKYNQENLSNTKILKMENELLLLKKIDQEKQYDNLKIGFYKKIYLAFLKNNNKIFEWKHYFCKKDIENLSKKIKKTKQINKLEEIIELKKASFKTNEDAKVYNSKELAKKIAYVPQILDFPSNIKVYDFIKMGRFPHANLLGFSLKNEDEIILNALKQVEMENFTEYYLEDLSGGQQQRCLIALALAQNTETIILDEPTNHLDIHSQLEIINLLHRLNKDLHKTIILVVHDLNYSIRYANKVLVLNNGKLVDFGDTQKVINESIIKKVFSVESKISLNEKGKKYIEYCWIEDESKLDEKELESIFATSKLRNKKENEYLNGINSLLKDGIITSSQFEELKDKIQNNTNY